MNKSKPNFQDISLHIVKETVSKEEWVKKAEETNSLLVILFHGVNGGNSLNVSLPEHSKFLHWLKQNQKDLWIAPMIDVAEWIKNYQSKKTKTQ